MGGIFISYHRQDSADVSGRIHEHLVARYSQRSRTIPAPLLLVH